MGELGPHLRPRNNRDPGAKALQEVDDTGTQMSQVCSQNGYKSMLSSILGDFGFEKMSKVVIKS